MVERVWTTASMSIATREGRVELTGLVYGGLGLDERGPKRNEPQWALTHLATGLQVCMLEGRLNVILPVATDIADCANWDSPGFRTSPELSSTVRRIGYASEGIFYLQQPDASPVGVQ